MQIVNPIVSPHQSITLRGVTLMELIIAVAILATGLVSIIALVAWANKDVDRLRQDIIAVNLAREGMEMTYNIRNTNRLRRAGEKDACWLKIDPLDDGGNGLCQDDPRMQQWYYIPIVKTTNWQQYFALSGAWASGLDLTYFDAGIDDQYALCYSGDIWQACPGQSEGRSEGRFFRMIEGKGLYLKDVNTIGGQYLGSCTDGNAGYGTDDCDDKRAKEFRFCSKVEFVKQGRGDVEMCGVLTNFEE